MKKKIGIILFLLMGSTLCFGQTNALMPNYFHYQFKIQSVTNLAEAKVITDDFRYLFKTYPTFVDSIDTFDFISTENILQSTFENVVQTQGNVSISFYRNPASALEIKNYIDQLNEE